MAGLRTGESVYWLAGKADRNDLIRLNRYVHGVLCGRERLQVILHGIASPCGRDAQQRNVDGGRHLFSAGFEEPQNGALAVFGGLPGDESQVRRIDSQE